MTIPKHLSHKPIIAADYEQATKLSNNGNDAKYLSIGQAQWDNNDYSAKIFRKTTAGKWSRQSEELPLPRLVDLCAMLVSAMKYKDGESYNCCYLKEELVDKEKLIGLKEYFKDKDKRQELERSLSELKRLLDCDFGELFE